MIRRVCSGLVLPIVLMVASDSPVLSQVSNSRQTIAANTAAEKTRETVVLKGHASPVVSLSFLTDNRFVLSSVINETRLWDIAKGETKWKIAIGGRAAVSPDGRRIAVRSATALQLFDAREGTALTKSTEPSLKNDSTCIAFSPDGRWIATGNKAGRILIWNADTAGLVRTLAPSNHIVRAIAFSPDSRFLACSTRDKTIRIFDVASTDIAKTFPVSRHEHFSLTFAPNGEHLISGVSNGELQVWDCDTGLPVRRLSGHIAAVQDAVFFVDGRHILSASDDHTVRYWDGQTGRQLAILEGHTDRVFQVAISRDGQFAATAGGGDREHGKWVRGEDFSIRIWRLTELERELGDATVDSVVNLNFIDVPGGDPGNVLTLKGVREDVLGMDLTADGRSIVTGEKNGTVKIWNCSDGRLLMRLPPQNEMIRAVNFSPDGQQVVIGTHQKNLSLWDVKTRRQLLQCPDISTPVLDCAFSPDGQSVYFSSTRGVHKWNLTVNAATTFAARGHRPHGIALSTDGARVASAGHDSFVRIWSTHSEELLHELKGHTDEVQSVAFDRAGRRLVSGSRDGTVRVWDVESGEELNALRGHQHWVQCVAFLSDGRRVVSGGHAQDGTIRVWDVETGTQVWSHSNNAKHTRRLETTPDARFAIAANLNSVSLIRLPYLRHTTAQEAYERARRTRAPAKRIAVLEFVDLGPSIELGPLRTSIAELLAARVGQDERIEAVERRQVEMFLKETKLGESGLVSPESAARAGQVLTADYLLSGTFSGKDGKLTVNAALTKPGTDTPIARWNATGKAADLFRIEKELAAGALKALGITEPRADSTPPGTLLESPPVAVLTFRNVGSVPDNIGDTANGKTTSDVVSLESGLSELLQVSLSALPGVKLVERERIDALLAEQQLTFAGLTNPETAANLGRIVGAKRLIYGSFVENNGRLTVIARLADAETAAVLGTEIADGTIDDIASLLEQISMRLTARLNVRRPKEAGQLVWRANPVRKLEAAVYSSRAQRFAGQQNYPAAIQEFDRALLVEPDSIDVRMLYIEALWKKRDYLEMAELAEETLALSFPKHRGRDRDEVRYNLFAALRSVYPASKRREIAQRVAERFPNDKTIQSQVVNLGRTDTDRDRLEGTKTAQLENELVRAKAGGDDGNVGQKLLQLFDHHRTTWRWEKGRLVVPKKNAELALAAAKELLELCKSRHPARKSWGRSIMPAMTKVEFFDESKGREQVILDGDEKLEFLRRYMEVFSDSKEVAALGAFELGKHCEISERYEEAVAAFRHYAQIPASVGVRRISDYDSIGIPLDDRLGQEIEAVYRVGHILQGELKQPEEAEMVFQEFVRRFGLANFHGSDVVRGLSKLNSKPVFPKRSVLIWGGAEKTYQSWQKVLRPLGFRVHAVRQKFPSAASFAPYDLVVVVRSDAQTFDPSDIFALRSYVATGGSAAIVLSPAYHAAAAGTHQALLSLFDVSSGTEDIDPAPATEIDADHPITRGVPAATARHAVMLNCEQSRALVQSEGGTLLAAFPYRRGRVVISSFGQWLLPDPTVAGNQWKHEINRFYGKSRPLDSWALEEFRGTNATLLNQSIAWLTDPGRHDELSKDVSLLFDEALHALRQFQGLTIDRDQMRAAMKSLVDETSGQDREEALWLAGESELCMANFPKSGYLSHPVYGYSREAGFKQPDPQFFRQLAEQYPESALRPFAECRAVDCRFRSLLKSYEANSVSAIEQVVAKYDIVSAREGSTAWAWKTIRIGRLKYRAKDYAAAAKRWGTVAEVMPTGPEKVVALLDLVSAQLKLNQPEAARKTVDAVMALPLYQWEEKSWERLYPQKEWGDSHRRATRLRRGL